MVRRQITVSEMRRELKALGYRARVKIGSEFSTAVVFKGDTQVNGANIITPEFLEEHQPFFSWKSGVTVIDNGWRTIV